MPGVNPKYQTGPRTYEVTANVIGGQLLEASTVASTTGLPTARVAAAGSATVIGVAAKDSIPVANQAAFQQTNAAYPGAFPTTDLNVPNETCAVYNDELAIPVTFAAAATYRQPLKAAANGAVTPLVVGTDAPGLQVGWCAQPGGVASAGVGLARILV